MHKGSRLDYVRARTALHLERKGFCPLSAEISGHQPVCINFVFRPEKLILIDTPGGWTIGSKISMRAKRRWVVSRDNEESELPYKLEKEQAY